MQTNGTTPGEHQVKQQTSSSSFNKKRSSLASDLGDTSFHETLRRSEKGIILYAGQPQILFCDLSLAPFQVQSYVFNEQLPAWLSPSYTSSSRLKYQYKLIVGTQRVGQPIQLLKMPLRVLAIHDNVELSRPCSRESTRSNDSGDASRLSRAGSVMSNEDEENGELSGKKCSKANFNLILRVFKQEIHR